MSGQGVQQRRIQVAGIGSSLLYGGPQHPREAVVFVHGNPGSSKDWQGLAGALAPHARVLAPDFPGFGAADKPDGFRYSVEGYGDWLAAFLDEQNVARVHLVLHDFGGPWGLYYAMTRPERIASVTLLNTGVLIGYHWHSAARIWRTPLLGELFQAITTREAFHRAIGRGKPRGLPRDFVDGMYQDYDRGTRRAVLKLYRATSDPSGMSKTVAEVLAPRRIPALVLWGEHDPYIGVEHAEGQRAAFPDAQVHRLDSGHWPMIDNPDAVAALVVPFVRAQLEGRDSGPGTRDS